MTTIYNKTVNNNKAINKHTADLPNNQCIRGFVTTAVYMITIRVYVWPKKI